MATAGWFSSCLVCTGSGTTKQTLQSLLSATADFDPDSSAQSLSSKCSTHGGYSVGVGGKKGQKERKVEVGVNCGKRDEGQNGGLWGHLRQIFLL